MKVVILQFLVITFFGIVVVRNRIRVLYIVLLAQVQPDDNSIDAL
jgi:hypothetical protein